MTKQTIRSEWIKFRTLRSTARTEAAAVAISIAITYLHCRGYHPQPGDNPTTITMFGVTVGIFFFAIAASMVATSEWTGATIAATVTATPHRSRVALSKVALVLIVSATSGAIAASVCYVVGDNVLGAPAPNASLASTTLWRALAGTVLGAILVSLLGLGLGLLFRRSVGAVVAVVVVLYLLPPLSTVLGAATRRAVVPYMPDQLIGPIINAHRVFGSVRSLTPGTAAIVLGIEVLIVAACGTFSLLRLDL